MKAVLLAAILVVIGVPCARAGTCEPAPKERRDNEKKYRARMVTGDKAFREGKYERARAEYRASLAYQDQQGAGEAYFRLGEAHAMLGNFDKAYTCIIESGPGKIPANRVSAAGISDAQARQAAQILLDTIQVNMPRYPYGTFPEYLALAAIFSRSGLAQQAQSAEEEGTHQSAGRRSMGRGVDPERRPSQPRRLPIARRWKSTSARIAQKPRRSCVPRRPRNLRCHAGSAPSGICWSPRICSLRTRGQFNANRY
jgi:hypothetical protein